MKLIKLICHSLIITCIASIALPVSIPSASAASIIIRVSTDGADNAPTCGLDWATPCDLEYALASRVSEGDEIWTKAGTYTPSGADEASRSFHLTSGVGLYGGFAGNETERSQRDWESNLTLLQGIHILYHHIPVIQSVQTSETTVLDGFTVTGDMGMDVDEGYLTLRNMTFRDNTDGNSGPAGIMNIRGTITIENSQFINNHGYMGAAISSQSGFMSIKDTLFQGNMSSEGYGGAIYNVHSNHIEIENSSFIENSAESGGVIFNDESTVTFTNSLFYGNSASDFGGAIANDYGSTTNIINCTFHQNTAAQPGASIHSYSSLLNIRNSILWESQPSPIYDDGGYSTIEVSRSIINGGYPGTGNLDADPILGTIGNYGGVTPTLPIAEDSPARDAVPVEYCTGPDGQPLQYDQRGDLRPQDAGCDMGSFEIQGDDVILLRNSLATVPAGMPVVIPQDHLRISHPSDPPEALVFTLAQLPKHGRLRLDGADLQVNDTFTQKDINDGNLVYYNDTSISGPDGFRFLYSSPGQQAYFNIQVNSPTLPPQITRNTGLVASFGNTAGITADQLTASSSQPASRSTFTLTTLPDFGELLLNSLPLQVGDTYTQEDIDAGNLAYHASTIGSTQFDFSLGFDPLIQRISTDPQGQASPAADIWYPSISYNGRYTPVLLREDNTTVVYIRDLETQQYERIAPGIYSIISGNGRYVLFMSDTEGIVPGVPSSYIGPHLYRYDRLSKTFEIVDVDHNGIPPQDGVADSISISFDGQKVLFSSRSSLLPSTPSYSTYIRDMRTGLLELASVDTAGNPATPYWSTLSGDGRYMVFDDLIRDLKTNTTRDTMFSTSNQPTSISYDGRFIVSTIGDGVIPGDTNGFTDIAVYDQITDTYTLLSTTETGALANNESFLPTISPDGRFVSYSTGATNLSGAPAPSIAQVVWHDRLTSETIPISLSAGGQYGDDHTAYTALPVGGRRILFASYATNLVPHESEYDSQYMVDLAHTRGSFQISVEPACRIFIPLILN